jgi:hypothetical protein
VVFPLQVAGRRLLLTFWDGYSRLEMRALTATPRLPRLLPLSLDTMRLRDLGLIPPEGTLQVRRGESYSVLLCADDLVPHTNI